MRKRFRALKNSITILLIVLAAIVAVSGFTDKIEGFSTTLPGYLLQVVYAHLVPFFSFLPDYPELTLLPLAGVVFLSAFLIRSGLLKELLFFATFMTVRPLIIGMEYSLISSALHFDYFNLGLDNTYYYYALIVLEAVLFLICLGADIHKHHKILQKEMEQERAEQIRIEEEKNVGKLKAGNKIQQKEKTVNFEDSLKLLKVEPPELRKFPSGEMFSLNLDEDDTSSVSSRIFEVTQAENTIKEELEKRKKAEYEAREAIENSKQLQAKLELEMKKNNLLAKKRENENILSDNDKYLFSMSSLAKKVKEDKKAGEVFSAYESGLNNIGSVFNSQLPKAEDVDRIRKKATKVVPETYSSIAVERKSTSFNGEEEQEEQAEEEFNKEMDQDKASRIKKVPVSFSSRKDTADGENDVDYVSGIGGLLNSSGQKSYLLDQQRRFYHFPPEDLLKHYVKNIDADYSREANEIGQKIVETLGQFKVKTELVGIQRGPTVTMYELSLAPGIRINVVFNLADNIAMQLAVPTVRILAPIPGKQAIGVEVPNKMRDIIGFDEMLPALHKCSRFNIPMALGKQIAGEVEIVDVSKAPHLLIAGTTGSGKSVCVNSLICSILYTKTPKEVRMIMVDPKMVELSVYNDIPHLLTPVITDPKKAIKAMQFVLEEMERRMKLFQSVNARKISDYNSKITKDKLARVKLPYILLIIDEFADLISVVGKELEGYIKRITAMARFTGIHLVLATQRPSADIITGVIKSNIPTRIAFFVSNAMNSRIILDNGGAEKLLGKGDMLFVKPGDLVPTRIQGSFIDSEIEDIVDFVKTQGGPDYLDECIFDDDEDDEENEDVSLEEDIFTQAWNCIAKRGEASTSYLQRKLGIGYNRAANIMEDLEDQGIVGPPRGSKAREVLRYPGSE